MFGVEGLEVFGLFAETGKENGQFEFGLNLDSGAAFACAVEFCERDGACAGSCREFARLRDCVGPDAGVDGQQGFMRSFGTELGDDAAHFR